MGILDSLPHASVLASPTAVLWWVFAALPHPFAITLIVCGFGLLMKWVTYVLCGIVRSCCKVCQKSRPSFTNPSPVSSETPSSTITRPADLSRSHSSTTIFVCPLCNGNLTVVPTRPEASQTHLTGSFQHAPTISHLHPRESYLSSPHPHGRIISSREGPHSLTLTSTHGE